MHLREYQLLVKLNRQEIRRMLQLNYYLLLLDPLNSGWKSLRLRRLATQEIKLGPGAWLESSGVKGAGRY